MRLTPHKTPGVSKSSFLVLATFCKERGEGEEMLRSSRNEGEGREASNKQNQSIDHCQYSGIHQN